MENFVSEIYYAPYGTICEGESCPCPVLGNLAPPTDIFGDCRHFGVYLELPLRTVESAGETSRKSVILKTT